MTVEGISEAVEYRVITVSGGVQSADVVTRVIAERGRTVRVAGALPVEAGAAVDRRVIVTAAVEEVAAENGVTCGRVVQRSVVLVALAIERMRAVSRCVVAAGRQHTRIMSTASAYT